jgi:hypothetical protein
MKPRAFLSRIARLLAGRRKGGNSFTARPGGYLGGTQAHGPKWSTRAAGGNARVP